MRGHKKCSQTPYWFQVLKNKDKDGLITQKGKFIVTQSGKNIVPQKGN